MLLHGKLTVFEYVVTCKAFYNISAIDIKPFQPLLALGPKSKWCGTVPFPLETLFFWYQIELCLFATIYKM